MTDLELAALRPGCRVRTLAGAGPVRFGTVSRVDRRRVLFFADDGGAYDYHAAELAVVGAPPAPAPPRADPSPVDFLAHRWKPLTDEILAALYAVCLDEPLDGVAVTFEVTRGGVAAALRRVSGGADLVVLPLIARCRVGVEFGSAGDAE